MRRDRAGRPVLTASGHALVGIYGSRPGRSAVAGCSCRQWRVEAPTLAAVREAYRSHLGAVLGVPVEDGAGEDGAGEDLGRGSG